MSKVGSAVASRIAATSTVTKAAAFGLVLVVLLGGGWLVGRAVGPFGADAGAGAHGAAGDTSSGQGDLVPGVASAQHGYLLVPERTELPAGVAQDFRFRIVDSTFAALTRFDVVHEKRLHLILVRRDGAHYQHVHPEMAADGTWSVPLTLPAGGSYRVFADFHPEGGTASTLGVDVHVPGDYRPIESTGQNRVATVDGYTVRIDGELSSGGSSTIIASVSRDGAPVTDLQPYLGAHGHLVVLRGGDLAYLHVHPEAGPAGPEIRFAVQAPTVGRYRLYLDFKHGDAVHSAAFTLDAVAGSGPPAGGPPAGGGHGDHGGHGG